MCTLAIFSLVVQEQAPEQSQDQALAVVEFSPIVPEQSPEEADPKGTKIVGFWQFSC